EVAAGPQGAVPVAQEHAHRTRISVGRDDVRPAVAVDVTCGHGRGTRSGDEGFGGLERPVAVPCQDLELALPPGGTNDVQPAIAVFQDHRGLVRTGGQLAAGSEAAIAIAQEDPEGVCGSATDEVLPAVAIDVADGEGNGGQTCREGWQHLEGTVLSQEDADGI